MRRAMQRGAIQQSFPTKLHDRDHHCARVGIRRLLWAGVGHSATWSPLHAADRGPAIALPSSTFLFLCAAPFVLYGDESASWRAALLFALVVDDPGCVKTHTSAKCRKYNSPGRYHASRVQYDLTLRYAISSRSLYERSKSWSFYTAKTQSGHRPD